MRLTSWEEERLLIFNAAELARRHRDRGLQLNAPEVVALICDEMLDAARAGATYADVERAGREAVSPDQALPGVAALVGEVRLEVLMEDGVRLVVLLEPLGPAGDDAPGAVRPGPPPDTTDHRAPGAPLDTRDRLEIEVHNTSTRVVRVTSHYPFERTNQRLIFDREAARGFRLDLPAGSSERWAPGETRTVSLVRARSRAQNA
jgi:urease subunit gamma/beta